MKNNIPTLAVAIFAAGSIFISCNSPGDKVEHAEKNVQDAKADIQDAKQDLNEAQQAAEISDFQKFKNESNKEINSNEQRIAELRIEMKNENKEAREKDEKKVDALEKKNHELKEKLEAYPNDGKSDWKEFKTEFKHDLDGLGQAFKDLAVRNTK